MVNSVSLVEVHEFVSNIRDDDVSEDKQRTHERPKNASRWSSLYGILILAACIANTFVVTSIPRHNSILYPQYWYEGLITVIVGLAFRDSWVHIWELYTFTKLRCLLSLAHFAKVFIIWSLAFALPYCTSYFIWTLYLEYNHPMPLLALFALLGDFAIYMIAFWWLFPSELRSQEELKRQSQAYLLWRVWYTLSGMILREALAFVAAMDSYLQWILPILIPSIRISSSSIAEKIIEKFPETNKEEVKFLVTTMVTISYNAFVTAKIYSLSQSMVYSILVIELLLYLKGCYEILKLTTRVKEENQPVEVDILTSLRRRNVHLHVVMNEFVDAILPLAFGIAFAMAYYGPNATLIKNVKNDYFGGQVIQDVEYLYIVMILMFSFDLFAMIISGGFLNYFCKIALFQEFCNMINIHWPIFLVTLPEVVMNFATRDINFGMDYTGEFQWINNEGRINLICNSTLISFEEKIMLLGNATLC